MNEANLTGESLTVEKSHKVKYTTPIPLADRKNMVFLGTTVAKGTGKAVVVQTGMRTELGTIANLLAESEPEPTPLQKDLNRLARGITWGCLGICGAIMLSGLIGGQPLFEMLRTGVSLAIGAIPEGLTSVLTISLAFGVQRMAKKGAIVKELPATEILSCADVICTDKTGTLTTGEMTVTQLYTFERNYQVSGGYSTIGKFTQNHLHIDPRDEHDLEKLITIGALCNNTTYSKQMDQTVKVLGDHTERALWGLAHKANWHIEDFACYTREKEIAFDSTTKKMIVVCKGPDQTYTVNIKGDPNLLLTRCNKVLCNGVIQDLHSKEIQQINKAIERMAENALRVIGFAYKAMPEPPSDAEIESDWIFVGLAGMIDPPRSDVANAIQRCRQAGIKPVMITGDHKLTAETVGRQIHLLDGDRVTITGDELDKLSDGELRKQIDRIAIFARTSPQQKLRIVKVLKEKGHIVVMTGDGVNDAPAIKEANIGIAMGKNGTAVTLDSSAIILTNDNFATIVNAIEEGRGISGNIKKFIRFVLSGNLGEVLAIFTASLLGLPVPLIPGQILMVNLITEGIPALAIGVDTPEKNNMTQPPRDAQKTIFDRQLMAKTISRGLLMGASTFGLFVTTLLSTGNLVQARTMAYANLVTNQMFHVFDCRKGAITENKYIVPSVFLASGLLLSTIYLSPLNGLFGTCPLGAWEWMYILFMSSFIGRLDYLKEIANQLLHLRGTVTAIPGTC